MELNIYINIKTDFLVYRMHNKNFKGLFKVTIFQSGTLNFNLNTEF